MVGFDFFGMMDRFNAEEAKTRSKAEILDLLRTEGEQFARGWKLSRRKSSQKR